LFIFRISKISKIKFFFLVVVTTLFTSARAQKGDCKDFYEGVYKIVSNDFKTHLIIWSKNKLVEGVQEDN